MTILQKKYENFFFFCGFPGEIFFRHSVRRKQAIFILTFIFTFDIKKSSTFINLLMEKPGN